MTEQEVAAEANGQEKNEARTAEGDTELENAIIRQVEYYFGDSNLTRDKFLREQVKLDEGWVPFEILMRFNRLSKLSTDVEYIANVLNKSTSGLLEVSEDNKKVRRNPEMPVPEMNEERRLELQGRTVYAKGFPKDAELDDLIKFFKNHGNTESIIMRRYLEKGSKKRLFKGSVFATFKTKEEAQKFMDAKEIKHNDTELIRHWQVDYLKLKQDEYAERKEKREKNKEKPANNKEEKEEFKLPTGTVFYFSEAAETTKREDIKDALTPLGEEVAYIDFKVGQSEGWVRYAKEGAAKAVSEKIPEGKLKIGESEVTFKLLEGDEEKAYLDRTVEEMVKRRKNQKNFNRNNKGKHFKGKQGRKRKPDEHEEAPSRKVKVDS